LIIGLLFGVSLRQEFINPVQSSFFVTGICGGFTTFSTFGLEQFLLIREGNYTHVLLYTFGSLILGVLAVGLGFWLARYLS
jgi:CrcB protein